METGVKGNAGSLRVLQAGYGAFGAVHACAWGRLGFADRLIIADYDREARRRAGAALPQARVTDDWRPALAEADVVDIATPSDTHADIAVAAVEAGCDVFIEKPMAANRDEAGRIAAAAVASGRIVQVGYVLRTHPAARRMRDIVRSGGIGAAIWISAEFVSLKRPRRDAGVVLNDAVHVIDLVLWTVGRAPDAVSAVLVERLGRGVEDIASITLGWRDGLTARIDASCIVAGEHPDPYVPGGLSRKRLSATGDAGQIVADFMTDSLTWRRCRQQRTADGWFAPASEPADTETFGSMTPQQSVAAELADFVDAVATRRQPDADVHSGVAMAAVCDAVFVAAREQRAVKLPASEVR